MLDRLAADGSDEATDLLALEETLLRLQELNAEAAAIVELVYR